MVGIRVREQLYILYIRNDLEASKYRCALTGKIEFSLCLERLRRQPTDRLISFPIS